ncbi:MAG: methylmalonyl-CoA mutase family protein, partial [Actinobacteria bacterium]|nr:methylmalonyl-CoA mutase family protein [Actinomycetota bacterium]
NNIVRVAYEAMASVLGGVQSMFTSAWDEPFALPTEESTTLALRTQQILAHETGVARTVDPLGGSYFVESLTDAMEEQLVAIMADLDDHGGMVRAIEDGYVQGLIAEEAWKAQRMIESGERPIVGVNVFQSDEPPADLQVYGMDGDGRRRQLDRLAEVKSSRSAADVQRALKELQSAAEQPGENLMPLLVDAVESYATVGEITQALRDVWGEYRQPVVF